MHVISVVSTKGGVGKTTLAANLGAFFADAGLRVILLDLDIQPTLSSYFALTNRALCGTYELLTHNESSLERLVSHTMISRLDVVISNDEQGQMNTLLLHAPDGRLRLHNLLPVFAPHYDLMFIDTQGARSVLLEMAVLASDQAISPVVPEILTAREFKRGTLKLMEDIAPYSRLGLKLPTLSLLVNRVPAISSNARLVRDALRLAFQAEPGVHVLQTEVPATEVFPRAATQGLAAHRLETRRPTGRIAPAALKVIGDIAAELCPQWQSRCMQIIGRNTEELTHAKHA